MSIWFSDITCDDLNQRGQNTMSDFLGIRFVKIGEDSMTATMPANERTKQPLGIVHGGANVVLAETVASTAANAVVDLRKQYCMGLEINANHIRAVRDGLVTAIARAIHLGRTTQIWHVDLYDEQGRATCISRMTAYVKDR